MTIRIRMDGVGREEIPKEGPEAEELCRQILAARGRGDVQELAALQELYRGLPTYPSRLAFHGKPLGIKHRHDRDDGSYVYVLHVHHDATDGHDHPGLRAMRRLPHRAASEAKLSAPAPAVRSMRIAADRSREIVGMLATWDAVDHRDDAGGWLKLSRHSFADFLRLHSAVPLLVDHRGEPVGSIDAFESSDDGLRCLAVVDRGSDGDRVLADIDSGALRGFSVSYHVMELGEISRWRGEPLYEVTSATIAEGSLGKAPLNPACTIETVGGRTPIWAAYEEARQRDRMFKAALGRRPRYDGPRSW